MSHNKMKQKPPTYQTQVLQAIRTVDARQTGGAEELVLLLAPALEKRGTFGSPILLLRKPDPTTDPARDFGQRARSTGLGLIPLDTFTLRGGWLRRLPKRIGVGIIHVHGQRANYFVWLMRRLYPRTWGRAKLVATVHGWVQDNFVRRVVTRLEWRTLRECDQVITVSEQQRQTLLGMGFDPDRVHVVRPGIPYLAEGTLGAASPEAQAEARLKWGLSPDVFVITAVGRLSTEKRFDLFLQACADIARSIPEARFMLVGGGKQETALKEMAAALGLGERLLFTGLTREMHSVYAATDLLMLTSDTEGTPHVLLEAMGSAIPVIATAVGGIPEFITSGSHGLLVPPGDRDALVRAAEDIHADPSLRTQLVAGGLEVASRFTVEQMAEGVEHVYKASLDRARK